MSASLLEEISDIRLKGAKLKRVPRSKIKDRSRVVLTKEKTYVGKTLEKPVVIDTVPAISRCETVESKYEFRDFSKSSKKHFECTTCDKLFGVRNVPKIIECGESVCHTCTQTIVNNLSADATEFNCPICGEIHGLPQYRVFKNNKFLLKILKLPYLPAIPKEEGVNKEELDSTIETKPVNETLTKPAEEPEIVPEPEIAPEPEAFIESNAETDLNEVSESGALPAEEVFTVPIPPPLPELDFFKIQLPSSKPEVAVELEKEALTEPTEEPEVFTLSIPSKKPEPEILEEPEEITAPLPPPKNKKKMIKLKSIDTCDIMVDQAMKPSSSSSGGGASKLQQLETILTTKGLDKVLEYCEDMRIDIQWCVELGVGTIQEKSESLLVKIDEFEAECTKNLGDQIKRIREFDENWKGYLLECGVNEASVEEAAAVLLNF